MSPQNNKWSEKKQTGQGNCNRGIVRDRKKVKMGREAQRKELVNKVSLKVNKPKGKDEVIGPGKSKKI